MNAPQCHLCGRFARVKGCRWNGQHGYAHSYYAVAECVRCGEIAVDWEWLGDFDPEAEPAAARTERTMQ